MRLGINLNMTSNSVAGQGSGGGGTDADAKALFDAIEGDGGTLTATEKTATNTLYLGLKSNLLYNKLPAFYPMISGSAIGHKYNGKDPRDLDAAFRLTFFGGWTHSATGSNPNGINAYANTYLKPLTHLDTDNGYAMGYYSGDLSTSTSDNYLISSSPTSGSPNAFMIARDNALVAILDSNGDAYRAAEDTTPIDTGGFIMGVQQITSIKLYQRGVKIGEDSQLGTSSNAPDIDTLLGKRSIAGANYTTAECRFAFISNNLTDSDVATLNTLVQTFQTTLGRQV